MSILTETLDAALKGRAPKFRAELQAKGTLQSFLRDQADEINAQVASAQGDANQTKPGESLVQKAGRLASAGARAREVALAQALESLPDETSLPSPGETTASPPTT